MKKVILAVAVIGAALATQAASVTWGSSKLFTASGETGGFSSTAIKEAATGYLFMLTSDQYDSFLADYTANGNMKTVYDAYKDSLGSATGTAKTSNRTSVANVKTEANVGDTVYGAIIYTYHDAAFDRDFYIANIATGTVGAESGLTIGNLGTYFLGQDTGTPTGGWQGVAGDIPEPTSGLLLLLGMAGLALRRKVA